MIQANDNGRKFSNPSLPIWICWLGLLMAITSLISHRGEMYSTNVLKILERNQMFKILHILPSIETWSLRICDWPLCFWGWGYFASITYFTLTRAKPLVCRDRLRKDGSLSSCFGGSTIKHMSHLFKYYDIRDYAHQTCSFWWGMHQDQLLRRSILQCSPGNPDLALGKGGKKRLLAQVYRGYQGYA